MRYAARLAGILARTKGVVEQFDDTEHQAEVFLPSVRIEGGHPHSKKHVGTDYHVLAGWPAQDGMRRLLRDFLGSGGRRLTEVDSFTNGPVIRFLRTSG